MRCEGRKVKLRKINREIEILENELSHVDNLFKHIEQVNMMGMGSSVIL